MKISTLSLLTVITFLSFTFSQAQEADPKIARLIEKVDAAQKKMADADALIFSADSLIEAGGRMVRQAEADLKSLAQERRDIERDLFNAQKPLERQLRSKDKEEVKQAKTKLKEVENENKTAMRDWDSRYKLLLKEYDSGNKLVSKGKANLKKAKDRKKDFDKVLKSAEKDLADAKKAN
ncbi:MAG: hypothetical protein PHD06_05110 [Bacteroidales bacterium]|nr:hypothetical protein [Bacteroidales bacterium]MDD4384540.1 hypothetical protein [Bacteroidales bacterium]MDY0197471.1 hypothetical protein [Tenuifilaceae bacterium]